MAKIFIDSWVMAEAGDIKRSVDFYAKLGLEPSMRMPFYVEFKVPGGTVLGLHSMGKKKKKKKKVSVDPNRWRIMFRVQEIRSLVSALKRKKIICSPVKVAPGGALFSNFKDPDGNQLTLIQMGG